MAEQIEEEIKKKKKNIICTVLLIIIIILGFLIWYKFSYKSIDLPEENTKIIEEIEGTYSGYQLILTASYGGYGVNGQDLGSGKIIRTYNISENDVFSEPLFGGIWKLNSKNENSSNSTLSTENTILKIIKFEENSVQLEFNETSHIINYNEEIDVSSNIVIYDGTNYSYTVKIIKNYS